MRLIIIILGLTLLGGCQTAQPITPHTKRSIQVTFVSFPPGAVIEIDGDYMGRTPNIIELREYYLEKESLVQYYKIFIYPPQDDYCVQKLALNPYNIPDRLVFDLSDCSKKQEDLSALFNSHLGTHPDTLTF